MSMMTTKGSFPVIDVTHKPKRMQGTNIRSAQPSTYEDDPYHNPVSEVPVAPTLERAIEYYESHAQGEFRVLYTQTAKWLRDYMTNKTKVVVPPQDTSPAESEDEDTRGR